MWSPLADRRKRREIVGAHRLALVEKAGRDAEIEKAANQVAMVQRLFLGTNVSPGTQDHPWAYENITWVRACVAAIADAVASVPLVFRDDHGEAIEEGPVPELFEFVNEGADSGVLKEYTASSLELHGDALWQFERRDGGKGCPIAITMLRPDEMEVEHDKAGQLTFYRFKDDIANKKPIKPEDMFHFRQYNPNHTFWGQATLEALEIPINAERQAELINYNILRNGLMLDGVLSMSGTATPEAKTRLQQGLANEYAGSKNAGKTFFLDRVEDVAYTQLGMNQKDAQFLQLRKMNRDQILAVFRVEPVVIGLIEGVNFATADVQRKLFWGQTIVPKLRRIAATVNENLHKLGDEADGLTAEFDLSGVEALQPDQKMLAETGQILIASGQWTEDEVREKLYEMEPKADEDVDDGNGGRVPADETGEETEEEGKAKAPPLALIANPKDGVERRKALWKQRQDEREPHVKELGGIVSRVWKGFTDEVVANLRGEEKKGLKATVPSPDVLLFDLDEAGRVTVAEMTAAELLYYEAAGNGTVELFNLSLPFDMTAPNVQEWAQRAATQIRTLPETYHEEIRQVIKTAIDEGLPMQEVVYKAEEFYEAEYGAWNTPGAQRIAQTEVNGAYANATAEAYKQNGVEKIEWLHSHAAREARPTHEDAEGLIRDYGETFPTLDVNRKGTHDLRWPHDPLGGPADNIWCRCDIAPVIE